MVRSDVCLTTATAIRRGRYVGEDGNTDRLSLSLGNLYNISWGKLTVKKAIDRTRLLGKHNCANSPMVRNMLKHSNKDYWDLPAVETDMDPLKIRLRIPSVRSFMSILKAGVPYFCHLSENW